MDLISYLIIAVGVGLSAWIVIKQKPWGELSEEGKKQRKKFMIAGFILVVFGVIAFLILLNLL